MVFAACGAGPDEIVPDAAVAEPDAALIEADAAIEPVELEIIGMWESSFGGVQRIREESWDEATVVSYDNNENFAITQNSADAPYNPSKFNKIVWTEVEGDAFYVCTIDYGKGTAEEAANTTNEADSSDPANSGCNMFSWTRLFLAVEIYGQWADNYGGTNDIITAMWGSQSIVSFNNEGNYAITLTPEDAEWSPIPILKSFGPMLTTAFFTPVPSPMD
jgi:hypothetical protein